MTVNIQTIKIGLFLLETYQFYHFLHMFLFFEISFLSLNISPVFLLVAGIYIILINCNFHFNLNIIISGSNHPHVFLYYSFDYRSCNCKSISPWLLLFSIFLFFTFGFVKTICRIQYFSFLTTMFF